MLAPFLVTRDHQTICFTSCDGTLFTTDVERFSRAAVKAPEEALALYRGALLPGVHDEWIDSLRAELDRTYVSSLERVAESQGAAQAIGYLRRAVESDPFNEPLHRKLLLRYAEVGDLAGLQAEHRNFCDRLSRELKASPSRETRELYERLVWDLPPEPSLPITPARMGVPKPYFHIPLPPTEIIGRERELAELDELMAGARLVTITGPGGVGKTRLALEMARQTLPQRGAYLVDLSSLDPEGRVDQATARSLGLSHPTDIDWTQAIVDRLSGSAALLFFDNCEHVVLACAELVHRLLSTCPAIRILATSRTPLGVPGEQRYTLFPLDVPQHSDGERIEEFASVKLFLDRARLARPQIEITAEDANSLCDICRYLDGIPLAIEMAAAQCAAMPIVQLALRLGTDVGFLANASRLAAHRHETLERVTSWSYKLLSPEARVLLRRFAIFSGGATLEAIESVCGTAGGALGNAVDASLIQFRDPRYAMLTTIQEFAKTKLSDSGEAESVRKAHATYFLNQCAGVSLLQSELGSDEAAARFRPDLENIRSARAWILANAPEDDRLEFAANCAQVLSLLQLDGEAVKTLRQALANPPKEPGSKAHLQALTIAGKLYQTQHADLDRATVRETTTQICNTLEALARAKGDLRSAAMALSQLAAVHLWWDRELAKSALEKALTINSSLPESERLCLPIRLLGQWYYDSCEYDRSLALFQQGGEMAERLGDTFESIACVQAQSHLHRESCRYAEALDGLLRVRDIIEKRPDSRAAAFNNLRLAELHLDLWDFDAMEVPLAKAHAFFTGSGSRLHAMLTDGLLRYRAAHEGRFSDALQGISDTLQKLLSDAEVNPSACWHGACIELETVAYGLAKTGRKEQAAAAFESAKLLRQKDWAPVSESVKARWSRLATEIGGDSPNAIPPTSNTDILRFVLTIERESVPA